MSHTVKVGQSGLSRDDSNAAIYLANKLLKQPHDVVQATIGCVIEQTPSHTDSLNITAEAVIACVSMLMADFRSKLADAKQENNDEAIARATRGYTELSTAFVAQIREAAQMLESFDLNGPMPEVSADGVHSVSDAIAHRTSTFEARHLDNMLRGAAKEMPAELRGLLVEAFMASGQGVRNVEQD